MRINVNIFTIFEENQLPYLPPFDDVPSDFDLVEFNKRVIKKIKKWSEIEFGEREDRCEEADFDVIALSSEEDEQQTPSCLDDFLTNNIIGNLSKSSENELNNV